MAVRPTEDDEVAEWNNMNMFKRLEKSTQTYDFVFAVTSLKDFARIPWLLGGSLLKLKTLETDASGTLEEKIRSQLLFSGRFCAIVGAFKVGKTFITQKLLKIDDKVFAPGSSFIPTYGISVKCDPDSLDKVLAARKPSSADNKEEVNVEDDPFAEMTNKPPPAITEAQQSFVDLMFFDCAGWDEAGPQPEDQRATETMIRKLTIKLAQCYIYVVQHKLTAQDQDTMIDLVEEIHQKHQKDVRLMVIHNCKDIETEELLKEQIRKASACFVDDWKWNPVTITTSSKPYVVYQTKYTEHYFLMNDTKQADYNRNILDDIRARILKTDITYNFNLYDNFVKSANELLPIYLHNSIWKLGVDSASTIQYPFFKAIIDPEADLFRRKAACELLDPDLVFSTDPKNYKEIFLPKMKIHSFKPEGKFANLENPKKIAGASFAVSSPRHAVQSIHYTKVFKLQGLVFRAEELWKDDGHEEKQPFLYFTVFVPGLGAEHLNADHIQTYWDQDTYDTVTIFAFLSKPTLPPEISEPLDNTICWGLGNYSYQLPLKNKFKMPSKRRSAKTGILPDSEKDVENGFQISLNNGVFKLRVPLFPL